MPNYTVEAIVLKRYNFAEKDRILTLLTPNHGKIRAIAKGVRRPGSKLAGHLELFSHTKIFLATGRNLDIITQAQLLEANHAWESNLGFISWSFYLAEIVEKVTAEREENYPLFRLYRQVSNALKTSHRPEILVSYFEMRLLDILGYCPNLHNCCDCGSDLDRANFGLHQQRQGFLCCDCRTKWQLQSYDQATLEVLRFFLQHEKGSKMHEVEDRIVKQTRSVMSTLLGQIMECKSKSSGFIKQANLVMGC
ncbi:MAG TPA: DNA repair protein RecO [Candidatus Wirthbacteria bacterium]|nr:DNA repair protein RecO [Candidatus Wirthbacteria bacterium]